MRDLPGFRDLISTRPWLAFPQGPGYFWPGNLIEKGGLRGDDNFPALSPAWPRQRPANTFAGLTRDLFAHLFLVCPRRNAASNV